MFFLLTKRFHQDTEKGGNKRFPCVSGVEEISLLKQASEPFSALPDPGAGKVKKHL